MKITGLSHIFKWENLHNWWLTKYFFAPLYIESERSDMTLFNVFFFKPVLLRTSNKQLITDFIVIIELCIYEEKHVNMVILHAYLFKYVPSTECGSSQGFTPLKELLSLVHFLKQYYL